MHTFFIDTTSFDFLGQFSLLYYDLVDSSMMTLIPASLDRLSESVEKIQQIIDKDIRIRNDFQVIVAAEISENSLKNLELDEAKNFIEFLVNQNLFSQLSHFGLNAKQFGMLFIERQKEINTLRNPDERDIVKDSMQLWPWSTTSFTPSTFSSERQTALFKEWLETLRENEKPGLKLVNSEKDSLEFLNELNQHSNVLFQSFNMNNESRLDSLVESKDNFTEEELKKDWEYRQSLMLETYETFINNKIPNFLVPKETSVYLYEKDKVSSDLEILSAALTVRNSVKDSNLFEKVENLKEADEDFPEALRRYHKILRINIDKIKKEGFPKFPLLNSQLISQTDHLNIGKPDFRLESISGEVAEGLKGLFLPRKFDRLINDFIRNVTEVTQNNETHFKESIGKIIQAFKKTKKEIIEKGTENAIFSEQTKECTSENIENYKQEIERDQMDIKMHLASQSLNDFELTDFSAQIRAFQVRVEALMKSLRGFHFFSFLFLFLVLIVGFFVPYYATDLFESREYWFVFIGTLLVSFIIILAGLLYGIHKIKQKIIACVTEFEGQIDENQKRLETVYLQFYRRFNQFIPNLLYINIYQHWFDNETSKLIVGYAKRQYHLAELERHAQRVQQLYDLFSLDTPLTTSVDLRNVQEGNVDVDYSVTENANVYTLSEI